MPLHGQHDLHSGECAVATRLADTRTQTFPFGWPSFQSPRYSAPLGIIVLFISSCSCTEVSSALAIASAASSLKVLAAPPPFVCAEFYFCFFDAIFGCYNGIFG